MAELKVIKLFFKIIRVVIFFSADGKFYYKKNKCFLGHTYYTIFVKQSLKNIPGLQRKD